MVGVHVVEFSEHSHNIVTVDLSDRASISLKHLDYSSGICGANHDIDKGSNQACHSKILALTSIPVLDPKVTCLLATQEHRAEITKAVHIARSPLTSGKGQGQALLSEHRF